MKENDEIVAKQICKDYHSRYCFDECQWFGNCIDQQIGDNLSEDEAICSTCGRIRPRWMMFSTNTGRNTQIQCPKCYLHGQYETGMHSQIRANVFGKMKGKK